MKKPPWWAALVTRFKPPRFKPPRFKPPRFKPGGMLPGRVLPAPVPGLVVGQRTTVGGPRGRDVAAVGQVAVGPIVERARMRRGCLGRGLAPWSAPAAARCPVAGTWPHGGCGRSSCLICSWCFGSGGRVGGG